MARLSIRLLGLFQVNIDGLPAPSFESNKVRALLAYLVVECRQAHSREKLAELFWHDMPDHRANANLSNALYNLRGIIQDHQADPPYLLRSREAVQFNPQSNYWLDVDAFNAQLAERRIREPIQLDNLQAAVDLYQGSFLQGLDFDSSPDFDEWVWLHSHRLQRQVMGGLRLLAEAYAKRGELSQALPYAWRQVELDPLDEPACRQLMDLLAASGKRNQALAQCKRLQILLAEELNTTPEPATLALCDDIQGQARQPRQSRTRRDNLPAFLTPMIGRQQELADIQEQCKKPECRLLTILGPGGSGKTHLALEVARACQAAFRHGVYFVPLNPIQSPASILPAIVEALDLPRGEQVDHQTQLGNYLREKTLLLILDGFEHLLQGAEPVVEILRQAPGLKILVTSRTRLNIEGEHLYLLAGMRYPEVEASEAEILQADGVQLLITSLQRTQRGYQPTPEESGHLLQICRLVLGMPLGILLAASWGATLKVDEIARMVPGNLDFLTAEWTDIPARQRSLRATFEYTWSMLGELEQNIFKQLSVFRGAFTRQAAQAISGASPQELRKLMDHSLLFNKTPGWYEIHELLRQYGREKLAHHAQAEQEVCNRHCDYYLGQLARLGDDLKGTQQIAAMSRIELEHENYRAAWNWAACQGASTRLAPVVEALCLYYDLSLRYADGESACSVAITGLTQDEEEGGLWLLMARLLTWQSRFTRLLGQPETASQRIGSALGHLEKARLGSEQISQAEAFLAFEQGNNLFSNDRAAATMCYKHSLQIYRMIEDTWGTAKALSRLGFVAHHAGNFQQAVEIYSESLELNRRLGDPRGVANALIELGQNSLRQGLVQQGEQYINEGVSILQQTGDQAGVARGHWELGRYLFWSGDTNKCIPHIERSIQIFHDLGMLDQYVFASIGIGLGLSHLGRYDETITRVNKNLPLAKKLGARREIGLGNVILGMAYLGKKDFKAAESTALKSANQYRELNEQEELSLALAILVYTHLGLDQTEQARCYVCEILQIGIDIHGAYPILYILLAAALLLIERGEGEKALEISALAECYPFVGKSRWFEDIAGREIAAFAASLPPEVVTAAQARGRQGDLWVTAAELLAAFTYTVIDSD